MVFIIVSVVVETVLFCLFVCDALWGLIEGVIDVPCVAFYMLNIICACVAVYCICLFVCLCCGLCLICV